MVKSAMLVQAHEIYHKFHQQLWLNPMNPMVASRQATCHTRSGANRPRPGDLKHQKRGDLESNMGKDKGVLWFSSLKRGVHQKYPEMWS